MTPPLITVAICTRNRAAFLEQAVRSVLSQLTADTEILIVDNGSTDGTARIAAGFSRDSPRMKLFQEPLMGLSNARNLALRSALGEWVVFLDDDARAEPGWLAAYGQFFSRLPRAHIVCAGGPVLPDYETPPPSWFESVADGFYQVDETRLCGPVENPWGCNYAVRRVEALAVGGFNPALGHCGPALGAYEEIEMTERLRRTGGEVWLVADARIRHFVAAERLRLGWQLRCAFGQGRCRAISRLTTRPTACRRASFIAIRILIAPFHIALNLLVVLVGFPLQNGRVAVGALRRASSIAGLTCEIWRQIFGQRRTSSGSRA